VRKDTRKYQTSSATLKVKPQSLEVSKKKEKRKTSVSFIYAYLPKFNIERCSLIFIEIIT
jgi:hypothetical protein